MLSMEVERQIGPAAQNSGKAAHTVADQSSNINYKTADNNKNLQPKYAAKVHFS